VRLDRTYRPSAASASRVIDWGRRHAQSYSNACVQSNADKDGKLKSRVVWRARSFKRPPNTKASSNMRNLHCQRSALSRSTDSRAVHLRQCDMWEIESLESRRLIMARSRTWRSLTEELDGHFMVLWDGKHVKVFSIETLGTILRGAGACEIRFERIGRIGCIPMRAKSMVAVIGNSSRARSGLRRFSESPSPARRRMGMIGGKRRYRSRGEAERRGARAARGVDLPRRAPRAVAYEGPYPARGGVSGGA
jgi:hypothetical protein